MITESALVLAVHPSLPVRTIEEFVAYARKNPGKLSYGTAGLGTAHHIVGETLKRELGIDMVHVPYRGGAPAAQALVANIVPAGFIGEFSTSSRAPLRCGASSAAVGRNPRSAAHGTSTDVAPMIGV